MGGDIAYPIVSEAPYYHQQLGEIVTQVLDCIEIQAWRGLHKYCEQLEHVGQCTSLPSVHLYLDLRHCLGQYLVHKKRGKLVRIFGSGIVAST